MRNLKKILRSRECAWLLHRLWLPAAQIFCGLGSCFVRPLAVNGNERSQSTNTLNGCAGSIPAQGTCRHVLAATKVRASCGKSRHISLGHPQAAPCTCAVQMEQSAQGRERPEWMHQKGQVETTAPSDQPGSLRHTLTNNFITAGLRSYLSLAPDWATSPGLGMPHGVSSQGAGGTGQVDFAKAYG